MLSKEARVKEVLRLILPEDGRLRRRRFMAMTGIGITAGQYCRCLRAVREEKGVHPTSMGLSARQDIHRAIWLAEYDLTEYVAAPIGVSAGRAPTLQELEGTLEDLQ